MSRIRQLFLMAVGAIVCITGADNTGIAYGEERGFAPSTPSTGETIVVTTVEDSVDFPAPQTVAELPGPDGRVSFREAVTAANNTVGPQTIGFAIPQSEWWLFGNVALLKQEDGAFLVNDNETTLDFSTQTAFTGDTNPNGSEVGVYGLEPNGAGSASIHINGNNCTVRGLGTVRQRGYALYIRGNNNHVVGCTIDGPLFAAVYVTGGFGSPPASGNIVGGTAPGEGNTLSAGNSGVRIDGPAVNNVVIGNPLLTGSFYGVEVRSAPSSGLFAVNNRIGGPTVAERNLIAGAGKYGEEGFPTGGQVSLQDAIGTIVQGNYIGTNAAGTASFGQRGPYGIQARNATDTQILDNLISGILVVGVNHYAGQRFGIGISLQGNDGGTVIRGNRVGTDASGQSAIPNRSGIVTSFWPGSSTPGPMTIGGINAGDGNRIAFNETLGVSVASTNSGVRISGNSLEANGGLGIDLISASGGGVTPNDLGDGDDGANGLQNFPVLQSAVVSAGGTTVNGNLNSLPNSQFSLEFFSNSQCDPSGFGEGATFLGSTTVTTDAAGNAAVQAAVAPALAGSSITATARHLATGNTSEFSACQLATGASGPTLQLLSAVSRKQHGSIGSYDVNLPLTGAPAVESRNSAGSHTFIFTFNNNVMSGSAEVESGTGSCAAKIFAGNTMTATVTGATDVQTISIVLSGVTDQFGQVLPDTHVSVGLLVGDVNGDGVVNSGDALQTRNRSGQSTDANNFRSDANIDGAVNSGDTLMVRSHSGASLL